MAAHKLLYFFFFGAVGTLGPFINLYFKRLGLSGAEIGVLGAMQPVAYMIGPPLAIAFATRFGLSRPMLPLLMAVGLIPAALLIGVTGFWSVLAVYFLVMLLQAPVSPFLDDSTLRRIEHAGGDYGRVRLWGSIGFIIGVNAIGPLSERLGLQISLVGHLLAMTAAALVAWRLATTGGLTPISAASGRKFTSSLIGGLRAVWQLPSARWLFVAGVLGRFAQIGGTNFFAIHADDLGMPESLIGLSWGVAVGSEVVLMAVSAFLTQRIGARGLFILSMVAGTLRWAIYASTSSIWVLLASQLLHALTFGAFHIGSVTLIHSLFPEESRTEGQSAWTVWTVGLAGLVGAYLAGYLYDAMGLRPLFWLSSLAALAGTFAALGIPGRGGDPGRANELSTRMVAFVFNSTCKIA